MSTVAEIREAIEKLDADKRYLLMAHLFAATPEPAPDDPDLLAALDEALADAEAGRVYSVEEVRAMIPQWISESSSPGAP